MVWKGRIHYLSGGTTSKPQIISYDYNRWSRSVGITKEVMAFHGVGKGSQLIILAPFSPWAIGPVFSEAALQLGASVYPLGLYGEKDPFLFLYKEIEFSHIVGTARRLISLYEELEEGFSISRKEKIAFVAGEKLDLQLVEYCKNHYQTRLVDIYGLAQFDTIAAQFSKQALALSPKFEYSLRNNEGPQQALELGLSGELCIRECGHNWFPTGDIVSIVENQTCSWGNCKSVLIKNRIDERLTLNDGTNIGHSTIEAIKEKFPQINYIQIQVNYEDNASQVEIKYMSSGEELINDKELISTFKNSSIDIYDCCIHGIISIVKIIKLKDLKSFVETPRGKIPTFINSNKNESIFKSY